MKKVGETRHGSTSTGQDCCGGGRGCVIGARHGEHGFGGRPAAAAAPPAAASADANRGGGGGGAGSPRTPSCRAGRTGSRWTRRSSRLVATLRGNGHTGLRLRGQRSTCCGSRSRPWRPLRSGEGSSAFTAVRAVLGQLRRLQGQWGHRSPREAGRHPARRRLAVADAQRTRSSPPTRAGYSARSPSSSASTPGAASRRRSVHQPRRPSRSTTARTTCSGRPSSSGGGR